MFRIGRHIREAVIGIIRNFWMSFSAIVAVTITLSLLVVFVILAANVNTFTSDVEQSIKIHVMIDKKAPQTAYYNPKTKQDPMGDQIRKIEGVEKVTYSSKDDELDALIKSYGKDGKIFESYRKDNPLYNAYVVTVDNGDNLDIVTTKIEAMDNIYKVQYGGEGVNKLIVMFDKVNYGLLVFVVALLVLAGFLISNTVKLTISARKTEIQIMRLVGANNGFIRAPFFVEGILVGVLGSLIPIAIAYFGYNYVYSAFGGVFFTDLFAMLPPEVFINQLCLAILAIGSLIGMVGATFSIGKYLKI